MQRTLITRPKLLSLALPALIFCLSDAQALSLDSAVNLQLGNEPGVGPCGRLLEAGANVTGQLANICSRAVPVGSSPSSSGGGSATPTAIPSADSGIVDAAKKAGKDSQGYSASSDHWGVFITAENEALDRNASATEGGFDSSIDRVVLGGSYIASATTAISLAVNISEHSGDFERGGDFSFDSTGLRLLGSFKPSEKLSLQVAAAYDDVSATRQRLSHFEDRFENALVFERNGTPLADYSYEQLGVSLRAAYEFNFGRLSLSPSIGVDLSNSDYGRYQEQGASGLELTFHNDERKSTQSALGLQGNYVIGTGFGAVIPQFSAAWRHEFEGDARNVSVSFAGDTKATQFNYQTDALDTDFFELSAGSVFVFKKGTQAFINFQTMLSNDVYDSFIASAGLRLEL